jgi:c-di-GMP-binding flagellar brake protein YcgR
MRPVNTRSPFTAAETERRWSRRKPLLSPASWLTRMRLPLSYRTQDIGEDGMSILGQIDLAIGTHGVVSFLLPTPTRGQVRVEIAAIVLNRGVAREREYRLGLQYEGLSADTRELILNFLGAAARPSIHGQLHSMASERSL